MKKILQITKTFYPYSYGGVEKVIETIKNGLKNKFEFTIFSTNENKNIYFKKKKHYSFLSNFYILGCPISFNFLFFYIKNISTFNIVHYHYPWPLMDILIHFTNKKIKKVVTYHSDPISKYKIINFIYFFFTLIFLLKVDCILVTSRNYFKSSKILKLFKKKVKIIPLGIKKNNPGKIYDKNFLLFLGSERKYKGTNILLEASKQINTKIIFAGNFSKSFIKKSLINKNISFVSNPNELEKIRLLKNCTLLVLPSTERSEAFGIVLLEAANYKKPVLTTLIKTGTTYVVKHNYNGIVIKPNDSDLLALKINNLISNKKKLKILGNNNYKRFIKLFTENKMLEKYNKIYNL